MLDLRPEAIQGSLQLEQWAAYYGLPYQVKPSPERVLIVGSGSGNDVAMAVKNGAGHVDAVEIDPAILEFGRALHPEQPYQAPHVRTIVNDARAFFRSTKNYYDLIVYGLIDSHSLLSSKSGGIRIDSYVYTVEGFKEARRRLTPDGVLCLTFSLPRHELGRKLYLMLTEAFEGQTPIVFQAGYDGGISFLAGATQKIPDLTRDTKLRDVTRRYADPALHADPSTDDWPFFLYARAYLSCFLRYHVGATPVCFSLVRS